MRVCVFLIRIEFQIEFASEMKICHLLYEIIIDYMFITF